MFLIADSGSTKTDWALVGPGGAVTSLKTQGINPVHQSEQAISAILRDELLPQLGHVDVDRVFFYGSGVRPDREPLMSSLLRAATGAEDVMAKGDLLGAARALCGRSEGLACILGTGANSCLFDGEKIVANTPPLGYILGDEGSGAVLGRELLGALYKGLLPQELLSVFESEMAMTLTDVIERVYRQPMPNRFLASLSPFIHSHLQVEGVQRMVVGCFRSFLRRNVVPYQRPDLPLKAVGSVAHYYREQLAQAAKEEGYTLGMTMRSPLKALVAYHASAAV